MTSNSNGRSNGSSNGNSGDGNSNGNDDYNHDTAKDYSTVDFTAEGLSSALINYVKSLRPGLLRFYDEPDKQLSVESDHVKRAVPFANFMKNIEAVGREGALGLAILTLYDLVMLVGMYFWVYTYFYYLVIDVCPAIDYSC